MADDDLAPLSPFILENVKELESGEKKGSGAYGTVYKVTVNGVTCIDKRLHDIFVNPEVPHIQRESIHKKFLAECIILSKLRHPHIVHFVGVRCGPDSSDLSLVMECLHTDLAKFLDKHQEKGMDIPLSIKLSILLDVSYGLLYLHMLTHPIIHRDLSANNILLTADGLQAKIADLGVSKLLDLQTQTKIAQTKVPGSQNYMPPEALTENPEYGLKLDIFSFGHLMLYTATQEFPAVHEVPLTPAILEQGIIQIVKRRKAISRIGGEQHCLHSLVLQCLRDKPEQRPTTAMLNESLKKLCTQHPRRAEEVSQLSGEADPEKAKLEEVKQWARKLELGNRQLSERLNKLSGLNADGNALVKELKAQVRKLEQEKESLKNEIQIAKTAAKLEQVKQKELEVENRQLAEQMNEIAKLNAEGNAAINELKAQVRELEEEKEALQNEIQIANTEAQIYKEDFELERHDREVAHGMYADLQRKYAYEMGKLEEHHKEKLAEVEHVHQGREKEMRGVLEEALKKKKNQQELQAKTSSQLKLYKKQVDSQRDQLSELEGHNKELLKERDKLFKELGKTRKELVQAKTKAEEEKPKKDAKKVKKEAKRKLSIKGATSPDPTGVSKALEEKIAKKEQLYEELRDENDTLRAELEECQRANVGLMTHKPENLVLMPSCRILEEDEEIEQEKVKQSLDLQLHKQQQLLQSTEEQTSTLKAGTLSGQAIPKANTPPVQCSHEHPTVADSLHEYPLLAECFREHPMFAEYFKEHSPASGFAAQPPEAHPSIGPALSVQNNNQSPPPPLPPKPSPTLPTPPVEQKEPPKVEYFDEKPTPVEHPHAGAQPCVGPAVVENYIQLPPKPSPIPPTSPVKDIYKHPPPVQEQPPPVKHSFASGFPAQPPGAQPCSSPPLIHQDDSQPPPPPPLPPKPSPIPPTSPVGYIHKPLPPVEDFHKQPPPVEHPPACDFVAQLNVLPGAQPCVGPAVIQQNENHLPPHAPKPSSTSPTSPSGSEIHQIPPFHPGSLPGTPFSQQLPQDSHLGAPGTLLQAHTYPQTPPVQQWKEPHLLSSQNPPQYYGVTELPHQKPTFVRCQVEHQILKPQSQQANRMQASAKVPSSPQEHLRSPSEDHYPI